MRGWNKSETSRHFLVSDDTIRDWLRRVDDDALVQTSAPVNRFPDVVRYAVPADQTLLPDARQVEDRREAGGPACPYIMLQRFGRGKRLESGEETAGEWRKAERVLFGSPLSFLHSPALLPRSGNGHAITLRRAVGLEGAPGDPIIFEIDCLDGRRHLPVIRVRRAA